MLIEETVLFSQAWLEKCVLLVFGGHHFGFSGEHSHCEMSFLLTAYIDVCTVCDCVDFSFCMSRYCYSCSSSLLLAPRASSEYLSGRFVHSALSEEEKTSLRAGLITNFNEPVNQVSMEKYLKILNKKKSDSGTKKICYFY